MLYRVTAIALVCVCLAQALPTRHQLKAKHHHPKVKKDHVPKADHKKAHPKAKPKEAPPHHPKTHKVHDKVTKESAPPPKPLGDPSLTVSTLDKITSTLRSGYSTPLQGEKDDVDHKMADFAGPGCGCKESTYGEIKSHEIREEFTKLDPPLGPDDVFYDLGSGRGLLASSVFLDFPIKRSVGVEMVNTRSIIACDGMSSLQDDLRSQDNFMRGKLPGSLEMYSGSMFDQKMDDATVVWMTATCFRPKMLEAIITKLLNIAERTGKPIRTLTVSKSLHEVAQKMPPRLSKRVHVIKHLDMSTSWSAASLLAVEEIRPPKKKGSKAANSEGEEGAENTLNCAITQTANGQVEWKDLRAENAQSSQSGEGEQLDEDEDTTMGVGDNLGKRGRSLDRANREAAPSADDDGEEDDEAGDDAGGDDAGDDASDDAAVDDDGADAATENDDGDAVVLTDRPRTEDDDVDLGLMEGDEDDE